MAVKVVAGLLRRGNKFLLVKRPINKKRGGLWEFPGGKVKEKESLEEALKRELKEELGIETFPKKVIKKIDFLYPEELIELYLLDVEFKDEPILNEASEAMWVTLEYAEKLDLCPADRKLLINLKNHL